MHNFILTDHCRYKSLGEIEAFFFSSFFLQVHKRNQHISKTKNKAINKSYVTIDEYTVQYTQREEQINCPDLATCACIMYNTCSAKTYIHVADVHTEQRRVPANLGPSSSQALSEH